MEVGSGFWNVPTRERSDKGFVNWTFPRVGERFSGHQGLVLPFHQWDLLPWRGQVVYGDARC